MSDRLNFSDGKVARMQGAAQVMPVGKGKPLLRGIAGNLCMMPVLSGSLSQLEFHAACRKILKRLPSPRLGPLVQAISRAPVG
jgi:hypothetical protein